MFFFSFLLFWSLTPQKLFLECNVFIMSFISLTHQTEYFIINLLLVITGWSQITGCGEWGVSKLQEGVVIFGRCACKQTKGLFLGGCFDLSTFDSKHHLIQSDFGRHD